MPKLYEYLGLIVLFYSNEHPPIHVHGKYQGRECKAELVIVDGKIIDIVFSPVRGKTPLNNSEMRKFKTLVSHYKDDIVEKWVDFFVLNKSVTPETISQKIA